MFLKVLCMQIEILVWRHVSSCLVTSHWNQTSKHLFEFYFKYLLLLTIIINKRGGSGSVVHVIPLCAPVLVMGSISWKRNMGTFVSFSRCHSTHAFLDADVPCSSLTVTIIESTFNIYCTDYWPTNKSKNILCFLHSKKCWVGLTQFWVKYGLTQPLGYIF